MGRNRKPCCEKEVVKKGAWSPEEDQVLVDYIQKHGAGSWRALPKNAGLPRCGKSCRLRWTNYLRPGMKRGPFSPEEEAAVLRLHGMLGNKWSAIASQLPGRTDNEIKNFWNTHLKKRTFPALGQSSPVGKSDGSSSKPIKMEYDESSLSRYMVQREDAGVEAEARLSKRSELLHSPTERFKYDPILWLWNSEVGESFQNTKGKDESTSGNPIAQLQASSSVKLECSSAANSDQATPVKTSTSTDGSYKQEDSYRPNLHVTAGSDSISSNEFSDSSDKALKLLLNDFPGANDMDFVQGDQGESFCDFLDLRCD